jgi:DNA-binding CsgD family transcriptional regulator
MRFHTVTVRGLPAEFPQRLQATVPINPLPARILSQLGRPVDMEDVLPDATFRESEIYRRVFAPFGIERILATGHRDDRSGLYSLVTLYRRAADARFTEVEKARQQHVTFHLFNAASHSFFLHLLRRTERVVGAGAAVIDAQGSFHEAQPRFFDLLEEHYPEHKVRESVLPFALPAAGDTVTRGKLCVRCEAMGDLFMVQVWKAGPLDRLTAREREIVMAVSQGLSFKQAARKIGVAPSTVANHLYRVYRKLGVSSRTELATVVHPGS